MTFRSTKTFGHEIGLSSAFRQWRAESHCSLIHGYALAIRLEFETEELDIRNWVVDFGSMKSLKEMLQNKFDHKLLVAEDDPFLSTFKALDLAGLANVVIVPATGCEKFAEMVFECVEVWLRDNGYAPRCRIIQAEVSEHGANSAIFMRTNK